MDLHVKEIAELIRDENLPPLEAMNAARAMFVTRLSVSLLDSVLRLLRHAGDAARHPHPWRRWPGAR